MQAGVAGDAQGQLAEAALKEVLACPHSTASRPYLAALMKVRNRPQSAQPSCTQHAAFAMQRQWFCHQAWYRHHVHSRGGGLGDSGCRVHGRSNAKGLLLMQVAMGASVTAEAPAAQIKALHALAGKPLLLK